MPQRLYAGNDNTVTQTMRDSRTGTPITNATMTLTVYDPHGATVATGSFTHDGDGAYSSTFTSELVVGVIYRLEAVASNYHFKRVSYEKCREPIGTR